jgi:hypothetical protein
MINIKISAGEGIDRLSILTLKLKHIKEEEKIYFIKKEIQELKKSLETLNDYSIFLKEMIEINEIMWRCNEIRKQKIIDQNFDQDYIKLTIEESTINDKRFVVKNKINNFFNSEIREQKSYKWVT